MMPKSSIFLNSFSAARNFAGERRLTREAIGGPDVSIKYSTPCWTVGDLKLGCVIDGNSESRVAHSFLTVESALMPIEDVVEGESFSFKNV